MIYILQYKDDIQIMCFLGLRVSESF